MQKKKKKEQFASTRPVGFAAGKKWPKMSKIGSSCRYPSQMALHAGFQANIGGIFGLKNAIELPPRKETLAKILGKIVELEAGAEFAPVKKALFNAVTKFGRADFKGSTSSEYKSIQMG